MSIEANKAFIRRYFDEVLKDKSDATVARFVANESLKQHIQMFEAAFPGYQLSLDEMVAEGDKVVVRTVLTGTHRGELMGIPPTGKPVSVPAMLIYRIANEKIVDFYMLADTLGMLQQLGAVPAPANS